MELASSEQRTHSLDRVLAYAYTLNWEVIAYLVIFVLAVLTRFIDLGVRVMSHDESLHTQYSWYLYKNGDFRHSPLMHGPLLFHMTAFFYLLFGANDFSARIYTAIVGVLVVMMPLLFRRWLGRVGALLASLMFLISPLLMYYSRYIRHDLPAILFALIMVYAVFQYLDGSEKVRRRPYWLYILAAAMALLLASKEVAFIYIAIFGSFLTLYWLVQLGQQFLRLRGGRSLFYLLNAGVILGGVAALAMIVVVSIIPPSNVWSTEGGFHITSPELFGRMVTWTLGVIGVLGVVLLGTAMWAMRGEARRFPWLDVALVVLLAAALCVVFLVVEEASRTEVVRAEPVDPNAPGAAAAGTINSAPIILAWVVGAVVTALAILGRVVGFWEALRRFPVFDVLILMGTLILPWLTAFVVYATGALPTDYSVQGITRSAVSLVPFAVVAVTVGLAWNWRTWLTATGIFMALFAFFFTTMFTNGQGLASGMIGSLGYWLEQQGVRRGNQPQYYYVLLMVPFYEFLPLIGSMAAGVYGLRQLWRFRLHRQGASNPGPYGDLPADNPGETAVAEAGQDLGAEAGAMMAEVEAHLPGEMVAEEAAPGGQPEERWLARERLDRIPFALFAGYWAVLNLLAYTLAGEKMPWLTTHLTVPLILVTAWYGGCIIQGISGRQFRSHGWQLLILGPLFLFALFQVINPWFVGQYPFQGLSQLELERTQSWLAALLVTAGVLYIMARLVVRIGWGQFWRLMAASAGIVLTLVTARSAFMASFINYDEATEFLVYAHAGPANKTIINWLEEISLRTTGSMNIRVAYDDKMSWPGSWYFRNFPRAVYFGNNPSVQILDDAVAVAVGEENRARVEPLLGDRYYHFEYVRLWWPMQDYFNLTVERIDNVLDFDPQNVTAAGIRRGLWEIWWNRDYHTYGQATGGNFDLARWPVADRMHFYVRKDVAAQVWDMGVGAEVIAEFDTSLADLWTQRAADLVWGEAGSLPGQLNHPRGIAVGQDGTVYVADSLNHRIQAFDSEGNYLFGWGSFAVGERGQAPGGTFNQPWGIAVGPDGNVYVADTWNHRIQVFTPEGEFIRAWGQLGQLEAAINPQDFWGPRDVLVDAEGLVYVADTGNKRIRVYTSEGEFVRDIGRGGSGAGQLNEPVGLAMLPDGRLFVADTWNRRIQVFDRFGQYLNSWVVSAWYGDQGNRPYLALDAQRGLLYVSDPDAARVLAYDYNGNLLNSFGQPGSADAPMNASQFNVLGGIATDEQGRLFVADAGGARILRFPPWDEIAVEPAVQPEGDAEQGEGLEEATEELTEEPTEAVTEELTEEPLDSSGQQPTATQDPLDAPIEGPAGAEEGAG